MAAAIAVMAAFELLMSTFPAISEQIAGLKCRGQCYETPLFLHPFSSPSYSFPFGIINVPWPFAFRCKYLKNERESVGFHLFPAAGGGK